MIWFALITASWLFFGAFLELRHAQKHHMDAQHYAKQAAFLNKKAKERAQEVKDYLKAIERAGRGEA